MRAIIKGERNAVAVRQLKRKQISTFSGTPYHIGFTPQPLKAVGVLFSPMVSGWTGGREKVCPGCISETVRCRKLMLGRDIGKGV